MRNLSSFGKTYKTKHPSQSTRIDPTKLPRKWGAPHRIDECLGGNAATEENQENYYRKIYCEPLDCIANVAAGGFDHQDLKTYIKLEKYFNQDSKKRRLPCRVQ